MRRRGGRGRERRRRERRRSSRRTVSIARRTSCESHIHSNYSEYLVYSSDASREIVARRRVLSLRVLFSFRAAATYSYLGSCSFSLRAAAVTYSYLGGLAVSLRAASLPAELSIVGREPRQIDWCSSGSDVTHTGLLVAGAPSVAGVSLATSSFFSGSSFGTTIPLATE